MVPRRVPQEYNQIKRLEGSGTKSSSMFSLCVSNNGPTGSLSSDWGRIKLQNDVKHEDFGARTARLRFEGNMAEKGLIRSLTDLMRKIFIWRLRTFKPALDPASPGFEIVCESVGQHPANFMLGIWLVRIGETPHTVCGNVSFCYISIA